MNTFFEGILKICLKKGFTSNEGETVEYFECYFLSVDGESLLKINTKQDLRDIVDEVGIAELAIEEGRKPRLISFKKQRSNSRKSDEE